MEDIEYFVFFLLGMWLFVTTRKKALFENMRISRKMAGLCRFESFVAQEVELDCLVETWLLMVLAIH